MSEKPTPMTITNFVNVTVGPPTCPACGSELALQMVEHPSGYVCLTCHPPEIRYVPVAEHDALRAKLAETERERDAAQATATRILRTKAAKLTTLDVVRCCVAAGVRLRVALTPDQREELTSDGLTRVEERPIMCAHCGESMPQDQIRKHILTCELHPLSHARRMAGEQWRRALDAERLNRALNQTIRAHDQQNDEMIDAALRKRDETEDLFGVAVQERDTARRERDEALALIPPVFESLASAGGDAGLVNRVRLLVKSRRGHAEELGRVQSTLALLREAVGRISRILNSYHMQTESPAFVSFEPFISLVSAARAVVEAAGEEIP